MVPPAGLKCGPRALCGRLLAELKAFENQKMELLTGGELEFAPWLMVVPVSLRPQDSW